MALIDWREDFETGIDEVDYEHRQLIDLINTFHSGVTEGGQDAEALLGQILVQISAHFALEEKDMQRIEWPEYEAHKEDHEDLLDHLRDIMDECRDPASVDAEHIGRRLADWFTNHFRTFDARIHSRPR